MNINQSLYGVIKDTAQSHPDNDALYYKNKAFSYDFLLKEIDAVSEGLYHFGIHKGAVVTMAMPNVPEAVILFYAVNKIGGICHMVHPLTPEKQMRAFMLETNSKTLIVLDTFFERYKQLIDGHNQCVLVNPTGYLPWYMRLAYRLMNHKRLKDIPYGHDVLRYDKLREESSVMGEEEIDPKATAVYLHSGGTTGKPKTIELSAYAINALAAKGSYILDEEDFTGKHMHAVLPMFHGFGLCMGIHSMLSHGGTDALMPKFSAKETAKLIKKNRVNYIIGVPSLFEALLKEPSFEGPHLSNLHQAFVGGDFVTRDLKDRFDAVMEKHDSQARLFEGYGLTEVVTVCSVNTTFDHNRDSVGKPLPGIDMVAVDTKTRDVLEPMQSGELAVSGDTMMNGYLNQEEATKKTMLTIDDEPYLLTGDYGFIDADGYVHFRQRLKRIVKVSGMPVLPAEIEDIVTDFKEIKEAAALGIPDEKRGFAIALFVVWDDEQNTLSDEQIKRAVKDSLSVYAVPKKIIPLLELPKTAIGKIDIETLKKKI